MNCYLHPDREAVAYCRTCGRPVCAEDRREIYGVLYCQECLARPLHQAAAGATLPAAAPAAAPGAAHAPSAGWALLLGFIPGVGAIYNGQYLKSFVQVVIFGFLVSLAGSAGPALHPVAGLASGAFYFYMVIDSYRTARHLQAGEPDDDILNVGQAAVDAPVAAVILIGIGVLFLLRSLGFFNYDFSRFLWPGLLIAIGLYLLLRHQRVGRD